MADVITKFYYLEHGKPAPKNSEFNGTITTSSIIGFKEYTKRKASKELSDEAKVAEEKNENFFNYTTQRIGATKTFSSLGWLDSKERNDVFKEEIANAFNKDGDVIWTPVISLHDFMTSYDMKLLNEEDYAAVFNKVLPKWFAKAGFENDNMHYWMDYHVNTDNPHIHLNFFEIKKTKMSERKKISMKSINDFKGMFWKEVFAKKRYLDETGKSVEAGFKNKDILKNETYKSFKESFKICSDQKFISDLKKLYSELPGHGRLQYNSSHMIPYREQIDEVVNHLLSTPTVKEKYEEFINSVREFDLIRSKNLGTSYSSFTLEEDKKLRALLGNEVLRVFKNVDQNFWKKELIEGQIMKDNENNDRIYFPIAQSLIASVDENLFLIRVPSTADYIYLDFKKSLLISDKRQFRVIEVEQSDQFDIFDKNGNSKNRIYSVNELQEFFSDGKEFLQSYQDMLKDKEIRVALYEQQMNDYAQTTYDWKNSVNKLQRASFSWMNEIEQEVDQARNEFLYGRELT